MANNRRKINCIPVLAAVAALAVSALTGCGGGKSANISKATVAQTKADTQTTTKKETAAEKETTATSTEKTATTQDKKSKSNN